MNYTYLLFLALGCSQVMIGASLPQGSYKNSCSQCIYDEKTDILRCKCAYWDKADGLDSRWTQERFCKKYKNDRGRLRCE